MTQQSRGERQCLVGYLDLIIHFFLHLKTLTREWKLPQKTCLPLYSSRTLANIGQAIESIYCSGPRACERSSCTLSAASAQTDATDSCDDQYG